MLNRTRKAFTMLELIVVIVILGILAAIAIPTFQAVINKSREAAVKRAAESIDREVRALAAFDLATKSATVAELEAIALGADMAADKPAGVTIANDAANTPGVITVSNATYKIDVTFTGVGSAATLGTPVKL